jgi:ethanolamine utilization protein EutA
MHDEEFEHSHVSDKDRDDLARYIWGQESLELNTVGIDIGSSTSHLLFARILMQRQSQALSSRFVVTKREVVWRSPIRLTPFLPDGTIDARSLGLFIHDAYRQAGFSRADIDSGAVILTGEAIKRRNAKAIDELFADEAGKFVCATAGHQLECTLAAHGSGAVALSKQRGSCILHVDIGGGTTKLALIDRGTIISVSAFAVGGRLLAADASGAWTRVDESAARVAAELGIPTDAQTLAQPETRARMTRRLADVAMDAITGAPCDALGLALQLTAPLRRDVAPTAISISGGVSEYIFGREQNTFGDIARDLADELRRQFATRLKLPIIDPGQGIRATVIGASQFTVQVSGKTIYLPDRTPLPVHNVPVVRVDIPSAGPVTAESIRQNILATLARQDLSVGSRLALAFPWNRAPEYASLSAVATGIRDAVGGDGPGQHLLLMMVDGDVGKTFGHLLKDELGLTRPLISIDGVQLQELDFVDVGEFVDPPGVVPIVIKSLLFS